MDATAERGNSGRSRSPDLLENAFDVLSGVPFDRLERMEELLGIPLPAATQWELVEETAEVIRPAQEELIRQAAQGEVLHNDDTSMRVPDGTRAER